MHFHFDDRQEHQLRAVDAVTGLFEGQAFVDAPAAVDTDSLFPVFENRLLVPETELLANLINVQTGNAVQPDTELLCIEAQIDVRTGERVARFPNISVEMETGTGKTYVYVRTALELYRKYGFRKFVVVVPSIAVREGVMKTFEMTKGHFARLYHNAPYRFIEYRSADLGTVRAFAESRGVEFIVMTLDSFNKSSNILRQPQWRLQGQTPIHLLQATRPILILDEPQNMESELSVRSLAMLNPLMALRYSATHRNPYNTVFRLTPFDALRQGLVKRIEVAGAQEQNIFRSAFCRLEGTESAKRSVTAKVVLHKITKSGAVREHALTLRSNDVLREKTNNPQYGDLYVEEIRTRPMAIVLADPSGNRIELNRGETHGATRENIFAEQIRYTVREHFRKQRMLRDREIKVLSLFFIDRVSNYHPPDSLLRRQFEDAFREAAKDFPEWQSVDPKSVHRGYFAEQKKDGMTEAIDSSTGRSAEDEEAFELIMRNKEELLSFSNPVSFVFSHSALREGWDNPNVFQICTLNQTRSDVRKRQEVGRGMRLCVDQTGSRVKDSDLNVLTMVTNQSYEDYVRELQSEIESDYGPLGAPPRPKNARQKTTIRLRKSVALSREFQSLWDAIRQKTRYEVSLDSLELIDDVVSQLTTASIGRPHVEIAKAEVVVDGSHDSLTAVEVGRSIRRRQGPDAAALPNVVDMMLYLLEFTSPPVRLTRRTLLEIVRRCSRQQEALDNPQEFAAAVVTVIKGILSERLIKGIRYHRVNDWYLMEQLVSEYERWTDSLDKAGPNSPYDWIELESEEERDFLSQLRACKEVGLFWKLPAWFTVPTPVGTYNPDWAILWQPHDEHGDPTGESELYLVAETKSTRELTKLRPQEKQKIECGKEHFANTLGVPYDVVVRLDDVREMIITAQQNGSRSRS